jgi:hypothetical protein
MELLLNLFWAMLVVPAALIWWRERRFAENSGRPYLSHALVSLACLLALLFPVISATDDMQAMRGEVEESSFAKRVVKQSPSARSLTCVSDGGSPARLIQAVSSQSGRETCGKVSEYLPFQAQQNPSSTIGWRAPPTC